MPALRTVRLRLEPLVRAHARALYKALQAPELYRFIPGEPPLSASALEERFARWERRESPDGRETWLNWAARQFDSDVYVGTVQATLTQSGVALLAYQVFPRFWRQGFAREACARVIAWLFAERGVLRVTADIDTRNVASIALVKSLGFRVVGETRNADFFKGAASDESHYELFP